MSEITLQTRTRIDLVAAFRWAARLGMHESIANHFSAVVSDDGSRFLLNPVGAHFSRVRERVREGQAYTLYLWLEGKGLTPTPVIAGAGLQDHPLAGLG